MKTKLLMVLGLSLAMSITACDLGGGPASKSSSQEQQNSTSEEVSLINNETTSSQNTSSFFSSLISSSQTSSSSQASSSSEQKSSSQAKSSSVASSSNQASSSSAHTHSWGEGVVTTEPGCETKGVRTFTCSCGETRTEEIASLGHDYGSLVEGYLPSYFYDGSQSYYKCSRCKQYFDSSKQATTEDSLKLERAGDSIAISVNGLQCGLFTQTVKEENHVEWTYSDLQVNKGDFISLTNPSNYKYKYQFFGNGNLSENNTIINSGIVDLHLTATPNGFALDVSGYKYQGLVVKINDNEYPLNKVSYLDGTETYIFGYVKLLTGDLVTIVDNVNEIVYGYHDVSPLLWLYVQDFDATWENEIIVKRDCMCGIEFDHNGDKQIFITKTFDPVGDAEGYYLKSSKQGNVPLDAYTFESNTPTYKEMTWYLFHEKVINNEVYKNYLNDGELPLKIYMGTFNLSAGESFTILGLDGRIIDNTHVVYSNTTVISFLGNAVVSYDNATFQIAYVPLFDGIFIYVEEPEIHEDVYVILNGTATIIQAVNGVAEYAFHANKYNTLSFVKDGAQLNCTLAAGYDSTVVSCTQGTIMFLKAGSFKATLNTVTKVVTITVIELDVTYTYYFHVLDMANSSNSKNYTMKVSNGVATAKNVTVTPGLYFYVMKFNDVTMDGVQFGTLDPSVDSSIASLAFSTYYVWNTSGTFNVSINLSTELITISSAS